MNSLTLSIRRWSTVLAVAVIAATAQAAHAGAGIWEKARDAGKTAGLPGTTQGAGYLADYIGGLISGVLGLLGVVFFILVVYAGFMWMTAGGNEEKVAKAKKMLTNSVIGIAIVIAAYAITNFVIGVVLPASTT